LYKKETTKKNVNTRQVTFQPQPRNMNLTASSNDNNNSSNSREGRPLKRKLVSASQTNEQSPVHQESNEKRPKSIISAVATADGATCQGGIGKDVDIPAVAGVDKAVTASSMLDPTNEEKEDMSMPEEARKYMKTRGGRIPGESYQYFTTMHLDKSAPIGTHDTIAPVTLVGSNGIPNRRCGGPMSVLMWGATLVGEGFLLDPTPPGRGNNNNNNNNNNKNKNNNNNNNNNNNGLGFEKHSSSVVRKIASGKGVPQGIEPTIDGWNPETVKWVKWLPDILAGVIFEHHKANSQWWQKLVGKNRSAIPIVDMWSTVNALSEAKLISDSMLVNLNLVYNKYSTRYFSTCRVFAPHQLGAPPLVEVEGASPLVNAASTLGCTLNLPQVSRVAKDGKRYMGDQFYGARQLKCQKFGGTMPDVDVETEEDKCTRLNSVRMDDIILEKNTTFIAGSLMQIRIGTDGKISFFNGIETLYVIEEKPLPQFRCTAY
jgi:hypothetical protein